MLKKNTPVYDLRMKYERANSTDIDALNHDVSEYLKRKETPSEANLAILGGIYFMVGENIEREAIKHLTRKEWAELEGQYVYKSVFTLPDLVDNLLTRMERGRITREQYEEERRKFKPCKHRFCLDYFIPRRKDQIYCSEDCRRREHEALKEYERTSKIYVAGTYLPPTAYKEARQSEKDKAYRKHERLFEPETLLEIMAEAEVNNGKRNRANEERKIRASQVEREVEKYEKVVGITRKSVVKTPLNVGKTRESLVKKYSEK
jgi:hypothetical protein